MAGVISCLESSNCSNLIVVICINLCSLWAKYRKSSILHLIVTYNKAYRILHNLPMRCSASLCLPMLSLTIVLCVLENVFLSYWAG